MNLLRVAGAALFSIALVAAPGVAAFAQDGDGVCTVTLQLPETVQSGQPFTMSVLEDSDCAAVPHPDTFAYSGALMNSGESALDDGIRFVHTIGTGNFYYQGIAPKFDDKATWANANSYQADVFGSQLPGGEQLAMTTMRVTPVSATPTPTPAPTASAAPTPTPTPTPIPDSTGWVAKAVWVNDTVRIAFPFAQTVSAAGGPSFGGDVDITTWVDGKWVDDNNVNTSAEYWSVKVPRKASAGPAKVKIVRDECIDAPWYCASTTVFSATVTRHVVKPKKGQVSAYTLLNKLKVSTETHSGSYAGSKFPLWVDANHDGESTRTEVLKSESLKKPVVSRHGTVKNGRWMSRYDGKTSTVAAKLDIDHLVPLKEAWTSGAAGWSKKKRTAYANDLGYGASLIAVSKNARQSKGGDEPTAYLPSKASYRCAYVRNWIAVKYRWGLTVDFVEQAALNADLTLYCTNPYVAKPATPNVTALVNQPRR